MCTSRNPGCEDHWCLTVRACSCDSTHRIRASGCWKRGQVIACRPCTQQYYAESDSNSFDVDRARSFEFLCRPCSREANGFYSSGTGGGGGGGGRRGGGGGASRHVPRSRSRSTPPRAAPAAGQCHRGTSRAHRAAAAARSLAAPTRALEAVDLTARVSALESQNAVLTAQVNVISLRVAQLQEFTFSRLD